MIRTGLKHVPWLWVVVLCFNTGVYSLAAQGVQSAPMQQLLSRFTVDPWHLSLISMVGPGLTLLVSPYVSWKSDRIWTRFGRRKPFMLLGWGLLIPLVFLAPLTTNFWQLMVIIFLWTFALDVAYEGINTPLFYEVVPSAQRGRAAVLKKGMQKTFSLLFHYYVFFQFASVYNAKVPGTGTTLTGAHVTYFVIGGCIIALFINIVFNVRETKPENPQPRETFNPVAFFRTTFSNRQWLIIYLLVFCSVAVSAGLPGLHAAALMLNQFGFEKAEFARKIQSPEILLNVAVIIPLAFVIADRFDRRMLFRVGIWASTLHALAMWGMVQWVGRPSITLWISMVLIGVLIDQIAGLALEPLIFDLIPPDQMGTVNSGFVVVSRLLNLGLLPIIGLFIRYYSFFRFGRNSDEKLQQYDYSSGFLLVFALGVIACGVYAYFEHLYRRGMIVAYGKTAEPPADAPIVPPQEGSDQSAANEGTLITPAVKPIA